MIAQLSAQVQHALARWQALHEAPAATRAGTTEAEQLQRAILTTVDASARLRQQYFAQLDQAHEHQRSATSLHSLETKP